MSYRSYSDPSAFCLLLSAVCLLLLAPAFRFLLSFAQDRAFSYTSSLPICTPIVTVAY